MTTVASIDVPTSEQRALEVISDLSQTLLGSLDSSELLDELLKSIRRHFGLDHCYVVLPRNDELKVAAAIGAASDQIGSFIRIGVGLAGVAAQRKRIVRFGNMRASRRYLSAMVSRAPKNHETVTDITGLSTADSRVAVPLVVGNELTAVFVAESDSPAVFTSEDARLFELVTTQIAAAIRNARTVESLEASRQLEAWAREETERALESLKKAQSALIQTEKLAGLGQLAAGVAHEVNTPLGAILASTTSIRDVAELISEVSQRREELDVVAWGAFTRALVAPGQDFVIGGQEAIDAGAAFEAYFDSIGLENGYEYADMLTETGLSLDMQVVQELLESDIEPDDLELIYRVRSLADSVDTIEQAANSAKKVVTALKSYIHRPSNKDDREPIRLSESIETVLVMYQNLLKYGVEVSTRIDSDVPILANSEQLMQVWTNIIHNAVQAMNGKGRISIRLFATDDEAVVSIANNGPPIPEADLARLFEAFYTTKPSGQGTGLGLHLCDQIVAAHGGRIEVRSDDETTEFRVYLKRPQR